MSNPLYTGEDLHLACDAIMPKICDLLREAIEARVPLESNADLIARCTLLYGVAAEVYAWAAGSAQDSLLAVRPKLSPREQEGIDALLVVMRKQHAEHL